MAITKINTRVQLKFDTWANWNSTSGKAFVPLKGEVCVCEIPANTAATGEVIAEKAYLIKVGDGTTTFGSLPWLSAQAADVHAWAKKSEEEFKAWLVSASGPALATQSEVAAISTTISSMDFTDPTASGTATSVITNVSQTDGKITATKKNLPTVADPTASGNSITFIDTVKQDNGKITATKKTVRSATSTAAGVVTLGASGGAATYARAEEIASAASAAQDAADAAQETADTGVANAKTANDAIAAMDFTSPSANGEAVSFIDAVSQTNGKITATKKTIPAGSTSTAGIVKLGVSGGAATYARAEELASEISGIQTKISNAMHFLGITTTSLSDGATTATITIKNGSSTSEVTLTAADAGAVVLTATPSSTGIQYEYVWTGSAWGQLGQEGSFAVKGSIVDSDISASAAITATKVASSLGGTNLNTDITGLDGRLDTAESNISALQTATGTTLPNAIQTAVDTLGASLVGTGSTSKTISKITYDSATNKATVTYSDIVSGSTSTKGLVQLSNDINSTSTGLAATANAVKTAYDKATDAASAASAAQQTANTGVADAKTANDAIAAMDLTAPDASGTATAFITTVSQTNGKVSAAKASLPTASTSVAGITSLSSSTSSSAENVAATPKAVKAAYDEAVSAGSAAAANANELKLTWQTSAITAVNSTNTPGSVAGTAKVANATTGISPLNIAEQDIAYIIFDCGSSTENI